MEIGILMLCSDVDGLNVAVGYINISFYCFAIYTQNDPFL